MIHTLLQRNNFIFKLLLVIIFSSATTSVFAQQTENYTLVVNTDSIKANLDQSYSYTTKSGEVLNLKLIQPELLTYTDDMITFNHKKSLSVSNIKIEQGIEQCMGMRASGNGFMIQKYKTMNPENLTQLILQELVKESITYGYTKVEESFQKKLRSGETLQGIKATLTYNGEQEIYTVATYGAKDKGIVVVTMEMDENDSEKAFIDLFLETLKLNN